MRLLLWISASVVWFPLSGWCEVVSVILLTCWVCDAADGRCFTEASWASQMLLVLLDGNNYYLVSQTVQNVGQSTKCCGRNVCWPPMEGEEGKCRNKKVYLQMKKPTTIEIHLECRQLTFNEHVIISPCSFYRFNRYPVCEFTRVIANAKLTVVSA